MASASLDDSHQGSSYRRIELITGESRRRRWTAEEKARILADSFQPGAQVSEVALRHGVNRGLLWSWRRQLRKQSAEAASGFVPIRLADAPAALPAPAAPEQHGAPLEAPPASAGEAASAPLAGRIDIEIGEVRVRVSGAVDTAALRTVLSHLGRAR
jgi:transposase